MHVCISNAAKIAKLPYIQVVQLYQEVCPGLSRSVTHSRYIEMQGQQKTVDASPECLRSHPSLFKALSIHCNAAFAYKRPIITITLSFAFNCFSFFFFTLMSSSASSWSSPSPSSLYLCIFLSELSCSFVSCAGRDARSSSRFSLLGFSVRGNLKERRGGNERGSEIREEMGQLCRRRRTLPWSRNISKEERATLICKDILGWYWMFSFWTDFHIITSQ